MKEETNKKANQYFVLASQYFEASNLLIKTIIDNKNNIIGVGFGEESALKNSKENIIKSDVYLLIPSLFTSLQSVELFIKGLFLLNNKDVIIDHEVSFMIKELKEIYGEKSEIYNSINNFYKYQIDILKDFKKVNNIDTNKELYESLRYPEKSNKEYNYLKLKYNGKDVIKQFELMLERLKRIKNAVLKEYLNNEK